MSREDDALFGHVDPLENISSCTQSASELMVRAMQTALSANASLIEVHARIWEAAARGSCAWCNFMSKRLEKDARFMKQLGTSETPETLLESCTEFTRHLAQDYQQEFTELSRMSGEALGGASEVARHAIDRGTSPSPEAARP